MRKDERIKEICEALVDDDIIAGFEYDHFREGEAIDPPFAVYRRIAPETFSADGITYHRGDNVDLEIYASDPDEMADIMDAVETLLTEQGIFYRIGADTVYIESEDFYETLYEI